MSNEANEIPTEETRRKPKPIKLIHAFMQNFYDLRYNVVKSVVEFREKENSSDFVAMDDRGFETLYTSMDIQVEWTLSKDKLQSYLNSSYSVDFDPFKSYLENLPSWDGTDYFAELAKYIKVEETDTHNFTYHLKKWLVRVIKCMILPKYFNKQMLVFVQADQNKGKSTLCRWFCPDELTDYFSESETQDKDEQQQIAANFLILFDELAKLNKAGLEHIKALMSQEAINIRLPYARRQTRLMRRASFISNSNQEQFLTDETGSVRYLCFIVKEIDFAYKQNIDVNKLYAQAYYLYTHGFDAEISQEDAENLQEYNKRFFVTTTEHDLIVNYFRPPQEKEAYPVYQWQAGEILQFLQDNNSGFKFNPISLGKALKFLNFKQKSIKTKGVAKYIYEIVLNDSSVFVRESLRWKQRKTQEI